MTKRARGAVIAVFLLGGALLLGLGFFADRLRLRDSSQPRAPDIVLVSPADGDSLTGSLRILFRTTARLELGSGGWLAGDLHPHILLDGEQLMAAADDIRPLDDGFEWRLPAPAPGPHRLLLLWAGPRHGAVGDTAGRTIRFFSY